MQLSDFSDARSRGICIHCEEGLVDGEGTRDHVPSKALLDPPYPENLSVVDVCHQCNVGFSKDEEYLAAFLASVICGSTNLDSDRLPVAAQALEYSSRLRKRIDRVRQIQGTLWGYPEIQWTSEIERIARVIIKNSRGHILFEVGLPIVAPPSYICIAPIQRISAQQIDEFENPSGTSMWPEVGSRSMQRIATGECELGGWIEVQKGVYRYAVSEFLSVRIALREYLAAEVAWDESSLT